MTIPDLTPFSGTKPNKDTQSSEAFDTNVQNWVDYTTELPDEINDFIDELAVEVSNITTQAGIATTQAGISTAQAVLATEQVSLATIQANNAASSAQSALLAPGTSASSTTSTSIGYSSKTFTIETGKLFVAGMTLKADRAEVELWLNNNAVDTVRRKLANARGVLSLWDLNNIGSDYDSLRIYGFFESFDIIIPGPSISKCSLTIRGIT